MKQSSMNITIEKGEKWARINRFRASEKPEQAFELKRAHFAPLSISLEIVQNKIENQQKHIA